MFSRFPHFRGLHRELPTVSATRFRRMAVKASEALLTKFRRKRRVAGFLSGSPGLATSDFRYVFIQFSELYAARYRIVATTSPGRGVGYSQEAQDSQVPERIVGVGLETLRKRKVCRRLKSNFETVVGNVYWGQIP